MMKGSSPTRAEARSPKSGIIVAASVCCLLLGLPALAGAQSAKKSDTATSATSGTAPPAPRLEPVFPEQNQNLIFVEGEDAVVTNFDKQPVLNYSASGLRTLQLSTSADPQASSGYYADYVFYVDTPGSYELWYGGTPPGPKGTSRPSYSSPFKYSVDGGAPVDVYASDVSVGKSYTPSFYWNRVGKLDLTAGRHQLQFRVTEKRKYDNRYFFYLDCFFLVRLQNGVPSPGSPVPQVFPSTLTGGPHGEPFKFIEDYLIEVRDHPANVSSYVDLSLVYSMVGDYLDALKYLNRAGELDPKNETITLLKAKNLLWKGEIANGLAAYRDLLNKDPSNVNLWAEAGKVAAWSGHYSDSISFFDDGLKHFPGNLNLIVNLGLTYLWSGDEQKAQALFTQAREAASKKYAGLMQLAQVLTIAQAYNRAVEVYNTAIKDYPRNLEGYLALEKLYIDTGRSAEAEKVLHRIRTTFVQSDRLNRFLELSQIKEKLKSQVIANYEKELAKQPDDLGLREILARAYFWNGMQERGTEEYLNMLANYTYRKMMESDTSSVALYRLLNRSYVFEQYFQSVSSTAESEVAKQLTDSLAAYRTAQKTLHDYQSAVDTARQKGQTPPAPPGGKDPRQAVTSAEGAVATAVGRAQSFLDRISKASQELKADQQSLAAIEKKEKSDQAAFEKVTASSKWHWTEADTTAELSQVQGSGAPLAAFSLGKIDQLEGRLSSAAEEFRSGASTGAEAFRYQLAQTLLWMGNLKQAATEAAKLTPGSGYQKEALGWSDLERTLAEPFAASGFSTGAPDEKFIQDLLSRLDATGGQSKRTLDLIAAGQSAMHGILRDRLVQAIYQNQEDTFQLRQDLGDYYLTERKFDDAVRQFRQVLSIDPWNIGALFRLGQVYQRQGNWKQALANYEKVYYSDPTFENVAHQYNNLARRHADSLSFDAQTTADTQRLSFQGSADYTTHLSSMLGLDLNYTVNTQRLYVTQTDGSFTEGPNSYRIETATAGVPVDLYGINLKLTPRIGATLGNKLTSDSTASSLSTSSALTPSGMFQNLFVDPVVGLDGALNVGKYFYVTGTYGYNRYAETYVPDRLGSSIFDNSGQLNLSLNLGFLGGYPFKKSSIRAYGGIDFLSDSNLISTVLGELDFNVFSLANPDTTVTLVGSAQLQNATMIPQPNYLYYAPIGELLAGGGVQGSTWLPVGNDTIGVSLRTIASSYIQKVFSSSPTKLLQLSGEARVEYDRGNSALYLDASATGTYQYSPPTTPPQGPWNYWSLTISAGYSAQLPSLLAP